MPTFIDRTSHKYGRLTVLSKADSDKPNTRWNCICDCGSEIVVIGAHMASGHTLSCGCLKRELAIKSNLTHGKTGSSIYYIWQHMIDRCTKPSNPAFKNYGARGITVCDEWLKFENFYRDMGDRPCGMEIDRINNACGYSKNNCRWATRIEQANNRRSNIVVQTKDGQKMTLTQFCKLTGKNYEAVKSKRLRTGVIDGAVEVKP